MVSAISVRIDAYVTVPAFAEHLNVSDKTVRKWIRAGVLPDYCFHGEWRIQTTDAIAFIAQASLQGTPDAKTRA